MDLISNNFRYFYFTFAQGAMTAEPAGVVTSTAQDELRCVLIFSSYIGARYWILVNEEMSQISDYPLQIKNFYLL